MNRYPFASAGFYFLLPKYRRNIMAVFELKKDPTKIIIAGTGSGWELMPRETEKTVYCLNDYVRIEKYGIRPDRLFIMDILDEKPQVVSGQDDLGSIIQRINAMKVPLVGPYKYEEIPLSEEFPLEESAKEFGHGSMYFTNTICYMVAYALLNGAKEIDFYGVNQAGSHEYAEEKGGVEYWIGVAVGRGVKVTINGKHSQLLNYKGRYGNGMLYGYLQSYDDVIMTIKKFGNQVIRKLFGPQPQNSRIVRTVNS